MIQAPRIKSGITANPLDPGELIKWAKDPAAGAVVIFCGITRNSFESRRVLALSYDAYVPRAEATLFKIAQTCAERYGAYAVGVMHRIGVVPLSEESVVIVVSAAHRREGWEAAEWVLEEIKRLVEIWKREEYDDGSSQWVEGTYRAQC